jgi:hypothetical protein
MVPIDVTFADLTVRRARTLRAIMACAMSSTASSLGHSLRGNAVLFMVDLDRGAVLRADLEMGHGVAPSTCPAGCGSEFDYEGACFTRRTSEHPR